MKKQYGILLVAVALMSMFFTACATQPSDMNSANSFSGDTPIESDSKFAALDDNELLARYESAIDNAVVKASEIETETDLLETCRELIELYNELNSRNLKSAPNGEEIESAEEMSRTLIVDYITKVWKAGYTDEVISEYAMTSITYDEFERILTKELLSKQRADGASYCEQLGISFLDPMDWPHYLYVGSIEMSIGILKVKLAYDRDSAADDDGYDVTYTGKLIYQIGDGAYYHLELDDPITYNGFDYDILLFPTIEEDDTLWRSFAGADITVTGETGIYEDIHGMLCLNEPQILY